VHDGGRDGAAGVDEDQAVAGGEGRDVGERGQLGDPVGDLAELVGRLERMGLRDVVEALEDAS